MAELTTSPASPHHDAAARREASRLVTHRLLFFGHAVVFASVNLLLLVVAGLHAGIIVALSWGIGLSVHAYYALAAPELRRRWTEEEVARKIASSVASERRVIESRHARSLEELSASIAHEIRNPITAAKSLVQQIGEDPASIDNPEYAQVALQELDRVERSVSHLLKYAREEELRFETLELSTVAESALATLDERISSSGARMEVDLVRGLLVRGDREALRRVVINLMGNALEAIAASDAASRARSPRIELALGRSLSGREVWCRVGDDGEGIPADRREKIWSPFYTSKKSGTGLGLAITRKIVEAHGGTIELEADSTRGAVFIVTLPALEERSAR